MASKTYWLQFQRQRISRRRLLVASGTGAAGLAVVAACGGGGDDEPSAEGTPGATQALGTPVSGGVYRRAIEGDWGTINPLTSVSFGPEILARTYNALVYQSSRQTDFFFDDLAQEQEQPDDENYIFTIRPGVKIAPNDLGIPERDLDSSDPQRWLEAIQAADTAVHKRFTDVWLDTFDAPTPQEFRMTTKGPYAYFFFTLSVPLGGAIPPKEIFEQEIDTNAQGAGAGPYVLRPGTFVETGGAVLDRNPNYYRTDPNNNDAQLPYPDGIEFSRISDRAPRRTAFASRQIHQYDPETQAEVDQLQSEFPDLEVFENPAFTFIAFTMNPTKPPWDDERVRMAANFALNRQEYVDVIVGGAGQPDGLVHWPLADYALDPAELEELQPYDPERARQLLQDAGHDLPLRVKVMYPANSDIEFHNKHLPIWLTQMRAAGFEIEEDGQEFTNWLNNYQNVNYDASLSLNQIYETPEVNLDFHQAQGPTSDGNYAIGIGQLFPEIDEAIAASKSTIVREEQIELVKTAQRLIYEKGPAFLPIMSWTEFIVRHGFVKNWPRGLGTGMELYVSDWWLEL